MEAKMVLAILAITIVESVIVMATMTMTVGVSFNVPQIATAKEKHGDSFGNCHSFGLEIHDACFK